MELNLINSSRIAYDDGGRRRLVHERVTNANVSETTVNTKSMEVYTLTTMNELFGNVTRRRLPSWFGA